MNTSGYIYSIFIEIFLFTYSNFCFPLSQLLVSYHNLSRILSLYSRMLLCHDDFSNYIEFSNFNYIFGL